VATVEAGAEAGADAGKAGVDGWTEITLNSSEARTGLEEPEADGKTVAVVGCGFGAAEATGVIKYA
jgi:hypothetical protein